MNLEKKVKLQVKTNPPLSKCDAHFCVHLFSVKPYKGSTASASAFFNAQKGLISRQVFCKTEKNLQPITAEIKVTLVHICMYI